jgi:N-methylhydantoinase B/oxoprolinase/acetone carboxylase alpha subunit
MTLSLVNNYMANVCREMGIAMMRTSYSPIFNESLDFSTVMFNARAELVSQADFVPSMVGAITFAASWTIKELGVESFEPGDVVVHNDPYRGGCHIPEHMFIKPVFHDDEIFGFVANYAHVTEIGGKAVGGFAADATDVHQEGLRIPPIKIMSRGRHVDDVWKMILTNHRTPKTTWGDFHALIGALGLGEARLKRLLERMGPETVRQAQAELIEYAERFMRAEISAIPDGEYEYSDEIEDDGVVPNRTYRIAARVVVEGDEVIVDFTGSDPQAAGAINCTYGVTASATYNAMLQVTDAGIPRNAGCYRPIRLVAPRGTVVNVSYPGPEVGGNSEIHGRIVDLLLACLAQAVPDRVAAATGGGSLNFLFGGIHPETRRFYAGYFTDGVGQGGSPAGDGHPIKNELGGNCPAIPVEVFETKYPFLTLERSIEPDSGGPGEHRGGCGGRWLWRVTAPAIQVSAVMDRLKTRPYGLFGGLPGGRGGLYVRRHGQREFTTFVEAFGTASPGKFSGITVTEGDEILVVGPGGGGFGPPLRRAPDRVLEDVREGLVSIESARRDYGVVIEAANGEPRIVVTTRDETGSHVSGPGPQRRPLAPAAGPPTRLTGGWVSRLPRLYETEAVGCDVCGKVIPRDYWAVEDGGRSYRCCDAGCERLLRAYWAGRYGDGLASEDRRCRD